MVVVVAQYLAVLLHTLFAAVAAFEFAVLVAAVGVVDVVETHTSLAAAQLVMVVVVTFEAVAAAEACHRHTHSKAWVVEFAAESWLIVGQKTFLQLKPLAFVAVVHPHRNSFVAWRESVAVVALTDHTSLQWPLVLETGGIVAVVVATWHLVAQTTCQHYHHCSWLQQLLVAVEVESCKAMLLVLLAHQLLDSQQNE